MKMVEKKGSRNAQNASPPISQKNGTKKAKGLNKLREGDASQSGVKNKGGRPKYKDRFVRELSARDTSDTAKKRELLTTPKKKQWIIDHYLNYNGNATALSKAVGIGRKTFYRWFESDPKFKEGIEDGMESVLDRAEDYLNLHIILGSEICLMFLLKCKGKARGYIEKSEIAASLSAVWEVPEWMVPSEKGGKKVDGKKRKKGNGSPD